MKKIIVCGASGFIGTHLVKRLRRDGHTVYGIDRKMPEFGEAEHLLLHDLRRPRLDYPFNEDIDECYQLAAEVGGLGYIMDKANDAEMLRNSMQINLNVLEACRFNQIPKIFFASSACVYPSFNFGKFPDVRMEQTQRGLETVNMVGCRESDAYPAQPDNEYAWEKLFAERLYDAYRRNHGIETRIGRFHNTFGPLGCWNNGREKAPAAICRKVAEAKHGTSIDIWGDGTQQRSFMYVDDAVEGAIRLMASDFPGPVNIGSSRMITIKDLAEQIIGISSKWLSINYIDGPVGVHGRNSDNTLIKEKLGWEPNYNLEAGLFQTYGWVNQQVMRASGEPVATINGRRVG